MGAQNCHTEEMLFPLVSILALAMDFITGDLVSWAGVERKAAVRLLATGHVTDWRYALQTCRCVFILN
ncbi:hypothetical protein M431DRAFT_513311 [Trichoderma harzianum CBS 226.95]|uniref:Uncharacterized protein n=1 Tax=Trichoderma harzianum CBS 226.95 TaxID=983964 RepID=A0A2T3ZW38_TRIHA|nr:hypothetical protein M431DRAFT_513311 [Trichoderma harzianum CBS 226.95]PTB49029.1 hypothetical protein M431DRAFT_513311 [Trichoderma harzianum CBS 226.95]